MYLYTYNAKVIKVYDADTMTLMIDVGFNIFIKERVRLRGIDTPELRTKDKKEKEHGYKARDFVRGLILEKDVKVRTYKKGKFGRYLAEVIVNGRKLNTILIDKKYAKPYWGEKKTKWVF